MVYICVNMHHRDCSDVYVTGWDHKPVVHGYMPRLNEVISGGDDTSFVIDNDTGMILDWTPVKFDEKNFFDIHGNRLDSDGNIINNDEEE